MHVLRFALHFASGAALAHATREERHVTRVLGDVRVFRGCDNARAFQQRLAGPCARACLVDRVACALATRGFVEFRTVCIDLGNPRAPYLCRESRDVML